MLFLYYGQLGNGIELGQCVNKMPVVIMIILLDQQKSEKRVYFKKCRRQVQHGRQTNN
jgi:hypothetical protein